MEKATKLKAGRLGLAAALAAAVALSALPGAALAAPVTEGTQELLGTVEKGGQVLVKYEVDNWDESGADVNATDDNVNHSAGEFVVTIPTAINFADMKAGPVDEAITYDVNVKGLLSTSVSKVVVMPSEDPVLLTGPDENRMNGISASVTQGKRFWTASEAHGATNPDGGFAGTTATDTMKLTGTALAGSYTGTVAYSAAVQEY